MTVLLIITFLVVGKNTVMQIYEHRSNLLILYFKFFYVVS